MDTSVHRVAGRPPFSFNFRIFFSPSSRNFCVSWCPTLEEFILTTTRIASPLTLVYLRLAKPFRPSKLNIHRRTEYIVCVCVWGFIFLSISVCKIERRVVSDNMERHFRSSARLSLRSSLGLPIPASCMNNQERATTRRCWTIVQCYIFLFSLSSLLYDVTHAKQNVCVLLLLAAAAGQTTGHSCKPTPRCVCADARADM
jgi:hypothetical protein